MASSRKRGVRKAGAGKRRRRQKSEAPKSLEAVSLSAPPQFRGVSHRPKTLRDIVCTCVGRPNCACEAVRAAEIVASKNVRKDTERVDKLDERIQALRDADLEQVTWMKQVVPRGVPVRSSRDGGACGRL